MSAAVPVPVHHLQEALGADPGAALETFVATDVSYDAGPRLNPVTFFHVKRGHCELGLLALVMVSELKLNIARLELQSQGI